MLCRVTVVIRTHILDLWGHPMCSKSESGGVRNSSMLASSMISIPPVGSERCPTRFLRLLGREGEAGRGGGGSNGA